MVDTGLSIAVALRCVAVGLLLFSVVLLARAWRRGTLQQTLAYSVLRSSRRSWVTTSLMSIALFLLLAGTVSIVMDLGDLPLDLAQPVSGILYLAASTATFALVWVGLASGPTGPERSLVLDEPEEYLASVGTVDRGPAK